MRFCRRIKERRKYELQQATEPASSKVVGKDGQLLNKRGIVNIYLVVGLMGEAGVAAMERGWLGAGSVKESLKGRV